MQLLSSEKLSVNRWHVVCLVLLMAFSLNFFLPKIIIDSNVKYLRFIVLIGAIAASVKFFLPREGGFVWPVQMISLSVFFSMFISFLTWHQGLYESLLATIPIMIWPVFFYLRHIKFPIGAIEKIVVVYGIIYIILYFFQLINNDTVYFGWEDSFDDSRGIIRVIFPGGGVFHLTTFIAINRLTTSKSNRWFWILLTLVCILVSVLQVTRQFIAVVVFFTAYHLIKGQKGIVKLLVLAALCATGLIISRIDNPVFQGLSETQKETAEEGSNYIRVKAAKYFINDLSPSAINGVFGNGVPYIGKSAYGNLVAKKGEVNGYYLSDVGIVAFYAMFGILPVIAYLIIWIKSFRIAVPEQYYYLKYYLWFLLLTCFTCDSMYTNNYVLCTILVLYGFQRIYEEQNRLPAGIQAEYCEN